MKRLILALIATFSLSIPTAAATWNQIAQDINQSVYRLSMWFEGSEIGSCTGFVIDQRTKKLLTAAHCVAGEMQIADAQSGNGVVLIKDEINDLAVVQFPQAFVGNSLKPGADPKIGDEVMAIGYGFSGSRPVYNIGSVAQTEFYHEHFFPNSVKMATTAIATRGMSGGPVVDRIGKVVSIVQAGAEGNSFGTTIREIKKATKGHWQYDR